MNKNFFATTPIYYPDGLPGIQTAYSAVLADCMSRYHRLLRENVLMLTGTDEHGVNIQKAAEAHHRIPQDFVDQTSENFRLTFRKLRIREDSFVRTSSEEHIRVVEDVFRTLEKSDHLYKGQYKGNYCISCESFWPDSLISRGRCPKPRCMGQVEKVREEGYFFRLSDFTDPLREQIRNNPEFVWPDRHRNTLLETIGDGIKDLCITRRGLIWGIPVPDDPEFTIYVWFDALLGYLTGAGYGNDDFTHLWPPTVQVIREDILTFHGIIWPAICMALRIPTPRKLLVHGNILINGKYCPSHQRGPLNLSEILDIYGADALRYFFLRQSPTGNDLDVNLPSLEKRLKRDLANDLGNLFQRSISMIEKYYNCHVPDPSRHSAPERNLERIFRQVKNEYKKSMDSMKIREALISLWDLVDGLNRYIQNNQPWKEENPSRLATVIYNVADYLRIISLMLRPTLPGTAKKMWRALGFSSDMDTLWFDSVSPGRFPKGQKVHPIKPLFPKVEISENHD